MSFLLGLVLVWMLGGEYTTISAPLGTEIVGPKAVGQALFTQPKVPSCFYSLNLSC
jgi:NADH-quinone oxidoreductase subunit J